MTKKVTWIICLWIILGFWLLGMPNKSVFKSEEILNYNTKLYSKLSSIEKEILPNTIKYSSSDVYDNKEPKTSIKQKEIIFEDTSIFERESKYSETLSLIWNKYLETNDDQYKEIFISYITKFNNLKSEENSSSLIKSLNDEINLKLNS